MKTVNSNFLRLNILEQDGKRYALSKWDGELWYDCFKVNKNDCPIKSSTRYEIRPIYDWDNCPKDEDGEYDVDQLETIGYDIREQ